MSNKFALRLFKLFVLILTPFLGVVYFLQSKNSLNEVVVPFKTFQAPSIKLRSLDHLDSASDAKSVFETVHLELKQPITLVNFWASWCAPCVEEFPAMIELQRQFEGKGFEIVFVSVDENPQDIYQFMKDNLIDVSKGRMFWDPEREASELWGVEKFPESYVVRNDLWVVEKVVGFQRWTRPVVVDYFLGLVQSIKTSFLRGLVAPFVSNLAVADEAPSLVHEDDKKTLEKLKLNIQTASQNYEKIKAELLKEERSVKELEIAGSRQGDDESDSLKNRDVIREKISEVEKILKKNKAAKKSELKEKKRIDQKIKKLQKNISKLEDQLKSKKTEMITKNQELNTRLQNIESLEKAENSSSEELETLLKKEKIADQNFKDQKKESKDLAKNLKDRKKRISKLEDQVSDLKSVLDKAKNKLAKFEKILKK